jgi:hypothetical protein
MSDPSRTSVVCAEPHQVSQRPARSFVRLVGDRFLSAGAVWDCGKLFVRQDGQSTYGQRARPGQVLHPHVRESRAQRNYRRRQRARDANSDRPAPSRRGLRAGKRADR